MAMLIVKQSTTLIPIEAEEITTSKKGSEYRGRALPLIKVISKNEKDKLINVYLNVYSGEVTAIRSTVEDLGFNVGISYYGLAGKR